MPVEKQAKLNMGKGIYRRDMIWQLQSKCNVQTTMDNKMNCISAQLLSQKQLKY